MHGEIGFIIHLFIILVTAGIGSFIAKKLGQPKLIGQIVGGIILGPSILSLIPQTIFIKNLAEIGVILLMFLAGLETDFEELKESIGKSSKIALGGILAPFLLGIGGMYLLRGELILNEALFVGVILTATSMGVTIQTLAELKELNSTFGMSILGAAVIDDILGILLLTVVMGVLGKATTSISFLILKIGLFALLLLIIGKLLSQFILKNNQLLKKLKTKYLLAGALTLVFLFSIFAQEFGIATIIGAYFIGLILSTTQLKEKLTYEVDKFGTSFFVPIFFVNIGLSIDLSMVSQYFVTTLVIVAIGIISKILGSYIGARFSGFKNRQSWRVGFSMIPRTEVSLIIATMGIKAGFIGPDIFSGVVLLVVVSIILSPWLLKKSKKKEDSSLTLVKHAS